MIQVLIPDTLIASIQENIQSEQTGIEQGGLLLGYRKPAAIQLDSATFPSRWDSGSATIFKRSARGHRIRALKEWLRSRRTIDWVGEWHTHPGGMAFPSYVDRRTWQTLSRHTRKPMTFLIFSDREMFVGLQIPYHQKLLTLNVKEQDSRNTLFGI